MWKPDMVNQGLVVHAGYEQSRLKGLKVGDWGYNAARKPKWKSLDIG
jgi:hypothetical protein